MFHPSLADTLLTVFCLAEVQSSCKAPLVHISVMIAGKYNTKSQVEEHPILSYAHGNPSKDFRIKSSLLSRYVKK